MTRARRTAPIAVLLALTLGWWFRRGDRAAQAEIEANRHQNPFQNAN